MIPPPMLRVPMVAVVSACAWALVVSPMASGAESPAPPSTCADEKKPAKEDQKEAAKDAKAEPAGPAKEEKAAPAEPKRAVFPKTTPASVTAYRAELEKPGSLSAAILSAACEFRGDRFADARAEIAFTAMWTDAELDAKLAAKIKEVRARAEAASARKAAAGEDEDAVSKAAHEAAPEWLELSRLQTVVGDDREASEAATQRLQALSEAATPQEWIEASLAAVPLLARAGKATEAEQLLEKCKTLRTKAEELRGSVVADAHLLVAEARLRGVPVRNRGVPVQRGDTTGLAEKFGKATGMLERELGEKNPATLASLEEWTAQASVEASRSEETVKLCERLLAVRTKLLGPEHPATIRAMALLSGQLPDNASEKAYGYMKTVAFAWMNGAGLGRPSRLSFAHDVAKAAARRGDYADAEKLDRALYAMSSEVLGPTDRQTLWHGNDLAIALGNLGDSAAAEKINREVWAVREKTYGAEDGETLTSLNNTAVSVSGQGRYREAEELYKKTLALRTKSSGENDSETLRAQANIASIRHTLGDFEAAEKLHTKTYLARRKNALEAAGVSSEKPGDNAEKNVPESVDAMSSKQQLTKLALDRGDLAKAEKLCDELLAMRIQVQGAEHVSTLGTLVLQAEIWRAQEKYEKAIAQLRKVLEARKTRQGANHPQTEYAALELGTTLLQSGDPAGAEPLIRGVLQGYETRLGAAHPDTLDAAAALGEVLLRKKDFAGAEPLLRRALEGLEKALDPQHPMVGEISEHLAEVLEGKGDKAAALPLAERAQAIAKAKLVKDAPAAQRADALVKKLKG